MECGGIHSERGVVFMECGGIHSECGVVLWNSEEFTARSGAENKSTRRHKNTPEASGRKRGSPARSARPTARQTPRTGFALRASLASDAAPARQGGGAERRARGATTSDRQKNEARRAQRRERAHGASGSARGGGSPQGRDRAGAACVTGRPLRETRAPRARRWRGERRARAHAARGGGGKKRGDANAGGAGSPPPRARARRGVPARRVRCTRGGAHSPRLGRGATRTRGGGGGLTPPRGEQ
jgi:hypothetical protein